VAVFKTVNLVEISRKYKEMKLNK